MRRTPDTEALAERLRIDYATVPAHPVEAGALEAWRWSATAMTLVRLGRYAEALAALDTVLEIKPRSATVRSMRDALRAAMAAQALGR